ncbi:V-type ATP synthase subunit C [Methanobrevibacter sp. OttesenSCG-928-K11]|nr:V-type ATP synthase subunit C [Methanobrevibacter sp. OttesenSCG-928-K11]MDL2270657.1 V-type ATP synthase subunit C [Methanobrevibacter sp. OttesenSCG-928-I08]
MADEITSILETIGITPETFIVFMIVVIMVVGAIVVIVTTRPILDIYPYLNPIAKVRARKGRLFSEKQITEIVDANNTGEVVNYLRGFPDYAPYLDNYSLDKALDIQLADTYDLIYRIAPKEIKKSFKIMSKKTDIYNIKSLIIAKEVGFNADETRDLLIPSGSMYDNLEALVDSDNITSIVTALDGTEYGSVLEDALPKYEETNMILPLEAALDNYYLKNLLASTEVPADENKQILFSYVGTQVDIANLKLIIRAKEDGLDYNTISSYILSDGYQLREWKLKDLMESQDVSNIVSSLEGTKYANILSDALAEYTEKGNVSVFEKALDSYLAKSANSLALKKPLGIGPIIGYVSKKETEIRNLKIIARAKREANYPASKIMEMLI